MLNSACVQDRGKAVQSGYKTVLSLCNLFVHNRASLGAVGISHSLYPALCAAYPLNYPRQNTQNNRGVVRVIPTVHSPNNKSYIGNLRINKGKAVEKENHS
jgi:hypothetical protein